MNYFIALVFIFLNLYNPITFKITIICNLVLYFSLKCKRSHEKHIPIYFSVLTALLVLLSVFATMDGLKLKDGSIVARYLQFFVICITYPRIISSMMEKKFPLMEAISSVLFLHCLIIFFELINPESQLSIAEYFGFNREDDVLLRLSSRKLGLTGSYDKSAFYAVCSSVANMQFFLYKKKTYNLIFFILSFISSFFTSRNGMLFTGLSSMIVLCLNYKTLNSSSKLITFILSVGIIYIIFTVMIPFLLYSLGFSNDYVVNPFLDSDQYSDRSLDLFSDHLLPLYQLSENQLIFGCGENIRNSKFLLVGSDVGYVKQIYEIGVVGMLLSLLFLLLSCRIVRRIIDFHSIDFSEKLLGQSFFLLSILCIIFHYKNYIIFCPSSFEIFVMLFIIIVLKQKTNYYER